MMDLTPFFFAATKPVPDLGHPAIALASVRTVRQHGNTNQGGLVDVYMMDMSIFNGYKPTYNWGGIKFMLWAMFQDSSGQEFLGFSLWQPVFYIFFGPRFLGMYSWYPHLEIPIFQSFISKIIMRNDALYVFCACLHEVIEEEFKWGVKPYWGASKK